MRDQILAICGIFIVVLLLVGGFVNPYIIPFWIRLLIVPALAVVFYRTLEHLNSDSE